MNAEPRPEPSGFEERADELLRESTLWPLWLVVIGHAMAFLAPALVFGLRDRRLGSLAALAILLLGTGLRVRADLAWGGGIGLLTRILLVTWLLACGAAWCAARWGML